MPDKIPHFVLENDLWWTTEAVLPSWKGFQNTSGQYGVRKGDAASTGLTRIVFAPEGRNNEALTESEVASILWVIKNEAALSDTAISSLYAEYPSLQRRYSEEQGKVMPDLESPEGLRALIGLHSVNVHPILKDGIPYVGFELGCSWDEEHGLGILVHGVRTVRIGGADTAILRWMAEEDAEKTGNGSDVM